MSDDLRGTRDLVLPPNTYAYVLDSTKGRVSVLVGPNKTSLSDTDKLVVWDKTSRRFINANTVEQAVQSFVVAAEGQYVTLENPTDNVITPPAAQATDAAPLEIGRKVNLSGPISFPLWPGQSATAISGHHLRHNHYLLVRVYDVEAARQNIGGVIAGTEPTGTEPTTVAPTNDLTMGQLLVIRGTDVSFYIPPTGIEVVPEAGNNYVREAVTLERLEYCILLDEDGDKRYVRGPAVVFPEPTEQFVVSSSRQSRKFMAIELNPHSGIYVKVIAEYDEEDGTHRDVGDELFITGDETAIFFPRPEHSIVTYDDRKVHYAIAIPAGEGRYVLNRDTGSVQLIRGPSMYLPDPRHEVVVLRILDDTMIQLLYPGNDEALDVNRAYRAESESSAERHLRSFSNAPIAMAASAMSDGLYAGGGLEGNLNKVRRNLGASNSYAGDQFRRGSDYTRPRSIVLDTKYDGAVGVSIWPGYAVLVTDRMGNRRVEVGPKVVLLSYDETVMPLGLSTGKPKTTDRLLRTAYLRVTNNQIGDIVTVECRDLVNVNLKVSYRVNFEGEDPLKWFDTENYVKILTDHARSRLRSAVKRLGVLEFTANAIDIVRDTLLGASVDGTRPGLVFGENGMRVYDVEVLGVDIADHVVAGSIQNAQRSAFEGAIQLTLMEERAERTARLEALKQDEQLAIDSTNAIQAEISLAQEERLRAMRLGQAQTSEVLATAAHELEILILGTERQRATQEIELTEQEQAMELERFKRETDECLRRMNAVQPGLIEAITTFGNQNMIENLVSAMGPAAMAAGVTTADIFRQIFAGTPFEGALEALTVRPLALTTE